MSAMIRKLGRAKEESFYLVTIEKMSYFFAMMSQSEMSLVISPLAHLIHKHKNRVLEPRLSHFIEVENIKNLTVIIV